MAIRIGDNVYRNLQEQVYENTNDIANAQEAIQENADDIAALDASKVTNPMITTGDLIVGGSNGTPTRLGTDVNKKYLTGAAGGVGWGNIEGTDVKSTGLTAGKVLTSNGSGGASFEEPATVYGDDINSAGATAGKVLMADGSDGADWEDVNGSDLKSIGATSGQVLTANGSGGASWAAPIGFANPMTSYGDLIVGADGSGTPGRLGASVNKKFLRSYSGTTGWEDVEGTDVKATGATSGHVLTADGSGNASWAAAGGGTQWYKHKVTVSGTSGVFVLITTFGSSITTGATLAQATQAWWNVSNYGGILYYSSNGYENYLRTAFILGDTNSSPISIGYIDANKQINSVSIGATSAATDTITTL